MLLMSDLPNEILENIFWFLDGRSLARVQLLCTLWNKIVAQMDLYKSIWQKCCQFEIHEEILSELLGNRSCSQSLSLENINWKHLYARWLSFSYIGKWPYKKSTISSIEKTPVSCIKLSGCCVISGHRNGSLHLWNVSGRYVGKIGQHAKMVLDLALLDPSCKRNYSYLDQKVEHEYVASSSKDHNIQIHSLQKSFGDYNQPVVLRLHSCSVDNLRLFGTILLASSVDNMISLWEIRPNKSNHLCPHIELQHHLSGPSGFMRWIGFWNSKISCLCNDSSLWLLNTQTSTSSWVSKELNCTSPVNTGSDIVFSNCFIYRDNIIIFLTIDRFICISIDDTGFRSYATLSSLRSYVVAVALVGNLLLLGTERGAVFAYYFQSKQDLLCLDLSKPTWYEELSEASIISIDVREHNGPVVACATSDSIYVIKWTKSFSK